jgi:hypothetical protein
MAKNLPPQALSRAIQIQLYSHIMEKYQGFSLSFFIESGIISYKVTQGILPRTSPTTNWTSPGTVDSKISP